MERTIPETAVPRTPDPEKAAWIGKGKVRARRVGDPVNGEAVEIQIDGITTQARYYKLLIYEFLRKDFQVRPRWGDFCASVRMEYQGEAPRLDLDNLAKAVLDGLKGFVFFDDSQIARLECERVPGERDRVSVRAGPHTPTASRLG